MIHHSNWLCDVCGERHSNNHTEECRDCLKGQLDNTKEMLVEFGKFIDSLKKRNLEIITESKGKDIGKYWKGWDGGRCDILEWIEEKLRKLGLCSDEQ